LDSGFKQYSPEESGLTISSPRENAPSLKLFIAALTSLLCSLLQEGQIQTLSFKERVLFL